MYYSDRKPYGSATPWIYQAINYIENTVSRKYLWYHVGQNAELDKGIV